MKLGIIPNLSKQNIVKSVVAFAELLEKYDIEYFISMDIVNEIDSELQKRFNENLLDNKELADSSDIIISMGGDGTMLNTAFIARDSGTPLLGINFGKLGFLAEFNFDEVEKLVLDIKENNFKIEERITLEGICRTTSESVLYAVNDIVINRGRWPKMVEMTLNIDDEYVSTFSADGLIIATPTGSTGYSLSTGGPIVSPQAKAITVSPISPHMLTMRPLVLSSDQKITVKIEAHYSSVEVSCDGQRVEFYEPPLCVEIYKSPKSLKLVHSLRTSYFDILRQKLYWGLDVRNNVKDKL